MYERNDIVLAVDYHDQNMVIRQLNCHTGEEGVLRRPTTAKAIRRVIRDAKAEADAAGGQVVWIMESTTGWARVRNVVAPTGRFLVANVLQMPLPPKARRKKTDKLDTGRELREYMAGTLPLAFQPPRCLREIRRLVAARESLVSRRTAVRNCVDRYLAHETWDSRKGLWSPPGMRRLRALAAAQKGPDRVTLPVKLDELERLEVLLAPIEQEILKVYQRWPLAQKLDAIYGIAEISAVSILARIGPIKRFASAEELIAFAGLAPGVRQSDGVHHHGKIGGPGTDKHLRHYIIEATIWARRIPRYRPTYLRVRAKRGPKVARLVVGRMLLRSIYKMLRDRVEFDRMPQA